MLRVAVDGLAVSHPDAAGRGVGRYVECLLVQLAGRPDLEVTALTDGSDGLPSAVQRRQVRRLDRHVRLEFYEHILRVGFDARQVRAHVFHSPGLEPPAWYPGRWVQTLHDVTPLVFPSDDWGVEPFRWRVRRALMRRADAVICVSQHVGDLAVRALDIDARRIHVVHHGVAQSFRDSGPGFDTDRPYVLMVSAYGPHKGFEEAFQVLDRLAAAGLDHELRVVGEIDGVGASVVARLRDATQHPDRIVVEGRLPDDELARRYRSAAAVVITSRYEGFGFPAVEAMAAGAPVVAFDNSSLPEIIGDGGLLVPDGDVVRFADELAVVLRDDRARDELRIRGRRRADEFSWDRCAQQHTEIYAAIA